MREIKFRAWDERREVMHNDFQFIKSGDENNDWIIPLKPITDPTWMKTLEEHCREAPHCRPQFHLMQYTGLLDKNKDPIYEGDILSLHKDGWDDFKVVWETDSAGFWLRSIDTGATFWDGWFDSFKAAKCSIIGNIYSNPELLESN